MMISITEHVSDDAESAKRREGIALMLVARMFSNEQEEEWLIQRRWAVGQFHLPEMGRALRG